MAARVASWFGVDSVPSTFSHTRHATQARGRFTSEGPKARITNAQMKTPHPMRGLRLRWGLLYILSKFPGEHESDYHCNPTDQNVWNIRRHLEAPIERRDTVDKNPTIEIALTGE